MGKPMTQLIRSLATTFFWFEVVPTVRGKFWYTVIIEITLV